MKTRIEAISKSKIISFENKKLEDIFILDGNIKPDNKISQEIKKYISDDFYEGILCLQTPKITDTELVNELGHLSENENIRIYILVGEYTKELDALVGRVLIRYGIEVKGTLILKNPTSSMPSVLFSLNSESNIENCFKKEVDVKNVVIELFRHFCYNFWEIAEKEILEKNKHLKVMNKPLDVYHNPNEYNGRDFILSTLFQYKEQTTRGEMAGKVILNNNFNILNVDKREIPLPNQKFEKLLNKEDFYMFTPELKDDGFSSEIGYTWVNEPYILPINAKRHSLYDKWEKKESEIKDKIETLFNRAKKINELDKLKDIQEFKNLKFSSEKKLPEYVKKINNVHNEISLIENKKKKQELEIMLSAYEKEKKKNEEKLKELKNGENNLKKKELVDRQQELENTQNEFKKEIVNLLNNTNKPPLLDEIKLDLMPSVGQLYEFQNKNFLAISYWEEYEEGLKESSRLDAKLCRIINHEQ